MHLGVVHRSQHRVDEADAVLRPIYDRLIEGFDYPDLRRAKAILDGESGDPVRRKATGLASLRAPAGTALSVGASVGIAPFPHHGEEAQLRRRHAYKAMYETGECEAMLTRWRP